MDKLQKDMIKVKTDSEKYAVKQTKELLKVYKRNLDDIRGQIGQIYMKYNNDDGELNISSKQRYKVLLQLEKQIAEQMKELGQTNIDITTDTLKEVCSEAYYKTAYNISKGIGFDTSFDLLKPEMVEAIINRKIEEKHFSERVWGGNINNLAKRVRLDVEKAIIQGQDIGKLARQIKKDFGSSAYQAKRLLVTETAKTVSLAQEEIYKNSDVVKKIQWDATLENNTCDECAALDGKQWDKNEKHPLPALHPSCRCSILPIVSDYKPTTKATKNPDGSYEDIPYMNYPKWKTYTVAKQNEPIITKDLKDVAKKSGGKLAGLEYRLKTHESYIRKVKSDMLGGRTEKEVLNSTYDIVRYTNVSKAEDFTDNFHDTIDNLSKKGYNIIRAKNTLSNSSAPYRGINAVIQNSHGLKFELQFHTEQSFQIKQLNHNLYEKIRQDGVSAKEKAELTNQMMDNSLKINAPKGVKNIKPFDKTKKEGS